MEFNWKGVLIIIGIAFLLFLSLFVVSAYAQSSTDGSYVIVTVPEDAPRALLGPVENGTISVAQGDTVYWGETVDLTGIGGWYGKLIHRDTGSIIDISSFTRRILIDPKMFTLGQWDQWAPYDEDNGNTLAFYVAEKRPPSRVVFPLNQTDRVITLKPYIQPIPVKHISDIIVARGDPLVIPAENTSSMWIFGRTVGYYDQRTVNNNFTFTPSQTSALEPATYTVVVETPAKGFASLNVRYDPDKERIEYFDPVQFKVLYVDLYGIDPKTRLDRFRSFRQKTQAVYKEYRLVVEDPYIDIISLDQSYINATNAVQTMRGYTNVVIGTPVTVVVDKDRNIGNDLKYSTFYTTVKGNPLEPGDMRWFELSVPILWSNMGAGHHSISVSTPIGATANVDFNVYESPDHTFIPNNTIKYMNGSEWRPDPTPIIITEVVTKEIIVTQTILVNVTPSQESVTRGHFESLFALIMLGAIVIFTVVAIVGIAYYLVSVYYRKRYEEGNLP